MRSISCLTPLIPVHGIKPRIVFLLPSSSGDANVFNRRLRPPSRSRSRLVRSRPKMCHDALHEAHKIEGAFACPQADAGRGSGPARSIPTEVRAGEVHASVCFAPLARGLLRGAGQCARPVRVLSARPGTGRCRVCTGGDAEDGDAEGRADPGGGSCPLSIDRTMPLLTLTVLAASASEAFAPPKSRCHNAHEQPPHQVGGESRAFLQFFTRGSFGHHIFALSFKEGGARAM